MGLTERLLPSQERAFFFRQFREYVGQSFEFPHRLFAQQEQATPSFLADPFDGNPRLGLRRQQRTDVAHQRHTRMKILEAIEKTKIVGRRRWIGSLRHHRSSLVFKKIRHPVCRLVAGHNGLQNRHTRKPASPKTPHHARPEKTHQRGVSGARAPCVHKQVCRPDPAAFRQDGIKLASSAKSVKGEACGNPKGQSPSILIKVVCSRNTKTNAR